MVLTQWKIAIIQFIREKHASDFSQRLKEIWPNLQELERRKVYVFLYSAQQWRTLVQFFLSDLKDGTEDLPWDLVLTIFKNKNITPPPAILKSLIKYLKKQKIKAKGAASLDEVIDIVTKKRRYNFLHNIQNKKQDLLASAKIAKSERLFEKQVSFLKELKRLFPGDVSVQESLHERERNKAEKVLSQATSRSLAEIERKKQKELAEERPLINNLCVQAREIVKKDPRTGKDFAVMFRQLGYPREGLDFLEYSQESEEKDWQLLDFFFSAKQFIALLHQCEKMKHVYSNQPDSLFSISYMEAQAFWELGEQHKAIELMRQITQMKPTYKSANELLLIWQEEVN